MNGNLVIPALIVLRRTLRPFNLDVARIGTTASWLAGHEVTDPLTYLYLSELRQTPLVEVRIDHARLGVTGFAFDAGSRNPFVLAFERARTATDRSASFAALRSVLAGYYASVQPCSALQLMALGTEEAPGLVDVAAENCLLPWGADSLEERSWRLKLWALAGSLTNRRKVVMPRHGMTDYGPVSERKLVLEVERVFRLDASIKANGFRQSAWHPMEVIGLRHGGEYRWLTMRGRHRFAACAAWGFDRVDARVTKVVRREDAHAWPRVVSGTFSERGALRLFDRLFAGEVPACALPWTHKTVTG